MKKIFLTVALVLATLVGASAEGENGKFQNRYNNRIETIIKSIEFCSENEGGEVHAVEFYDIDRIVIDNSEHARVRILDSQFNIVFDGTDDVDVRLEAGDYYVVSTLNITQKYINYTCAGY